MAELHSNFLLGFLGIAVGCYGTLVGAGGGFLLVPLFLLVLNLPHEVAVGTSLVVVAANACSGALGYVFHGKIDYRAGLTFALATLPGAVSGVFLTAALSGPLFHRVFGVFLFAISLYLFFRKTRKEDAAIIAQEKWGSVKRRLNSKSGPIHYSYNEPLGLGISVVVGAVSSWLGIGGGILHVPAMTEILRFPVAVAVATSHFILAFTAVAGAVAHGWNGHCDLAVAVPTAVGAILGAQLGVRIAPRFKGSALLRYLALALLAVGVRLVMG